MGASYNPRHATGQGPYYGLQPCHGRTIPTVSNKRMYMFYFYVLYSTKDKKLYYGFSSDLKKRFQDHSNGNVDATKHRRPLQLIYYEAYEKEQMARKREKDVKISGRLRKELKERLQII